jgi:hypothetical protein
MERRHRQNARSPSPSKTDRPRRMPASGSFRRRRNGRARRFPPSGGKALTSACRTPRAPRASGRSRRSRIGRARDEQDRIVRGEAEEIGPALVTDEQADAGRVARQHPLFRDDFWRNHVNHRTEFKQALANAPAVCGINRRAVDIAAKYAADLYLAIALRSSQLLENFSRMTNVSVEYRRQCMLDTTRFRVTRPVKMATIR